MGISNSSENIISNNQNTTTEDFPNIDEDISQNYGEENLLKQEHKTREDIRVPKISNSKTCLNKTSKQASKKSKRKLGFLQMRIDSTIYFDNMGYSYQIQNEKNDKK